MKTEAMVRLLVALTLCQGAFATPVITWNRDPIALTLVVGREQRLDFPEAVRAGVPLVVGGALRVQSIGGSLYLRAGNAFSTQRLYATLIGSGQVVVFDISAEQAQDGAPRQSAPALRIAVPDQVEVSPSGVLQGADIPESGAITPVTLARFAAQQFYAPVRLLREHAGIERVPLDGAAAPGLYAGADLAIEPLAAWQGGGLYVTAIRLTNRSPTVVQLDPRNLRGALRHAVFQHHSLRLGARGSATDTTLVYLITERPFAQSVRAER